MPVKRRKGSPYWQVKFKLAGRTVRQSSGTTDKHAAEELEEELRRALWRQIKLGEKHFTWDDAVAKCTEEDTGQRSWERTERCIERLDRFLKGAPLAEITHDNIVKIRTALTRHTYRGKPLGPATINRDLAVLRSILKRCAEEWKMLDAAPKVPLFRIQKVEPTWATRERVHALLGELAEHSRDMAILACATGMRRNEVTHLKRAYVDLKRATAYVPASIAKNGDARVVPLNTDAIAVLDKWIEREKHHPEYVFSFRGRAPIKQIATKHWRTACKKVGMAGFRFHDLRHTWASWQAQAGTPLKMLQDLGGWKSFEMVLRYAHLAPGHLAQYADRSLIGPAPTSTESGTVEQVDKKKRVSR